MRVLREGRNLDYPPTVDLRRASEKIMEGASTHPSELMQQAQQEHNRLERDASGERIASPPVLV